MAAEKNNPVSFDEIIQADRNRRKNEQLASEIFGRNKQNKDARRQNNRSSPQTPSLASRIGVAKTQRSSSSTSVSSQRPKPPSRPSSTAAQRDRSNRLASALNLEQADVNPFSPKLQPSARGLSIKGKAGPFPVIASNFAPGTTAADIESAVAIESTDSDGQNGLLSCRLTSENPSVVAELVFSERTIADRIISTYNNQRADGRVLRLVHKKPSTPSIPQPLPSSDDPIQAKEEDVDMMATEAPATSDSQDPTSSRYDTDREAANKERQSSRRGGGPAEPDVVEDGYTSTRPAEPGTEDHNGGSRRDDDRDRDRDRERDRRYDDRSYERRDDRDRDRDRERDRDRDRERRYDSRGSYGGRPSHYGNGVGGAGMGGAPGPSPMGPRGGSGYGGFPSRGGRMYSDEMMRGRGGMRGGYRGGYR